ncbi:MAG: hypothetical protein JRJ03_10265 [Deltaproteobacteria bacterium]|nr:hypothetical protein [Deltaproteobacteria bacterium]
MKLFPIVFELQSPLHIGYLPNRPGTVLAPTRYYVPKKNLWGAVTSALTPKLHTNPSPEHYRRIGEEIKDAISFSYFYLSDGKEIFIPQYRDEGLFWGNLSASEFERKFIHSRVSTKISSRGSAEDGTLHEIEYILNQIIGEDGEFLPVFLVGSINIREGASVDGKLINEKNIQLDDIPIFDDLAVGGERNYGFGRMKRIDSDRLGKIQNTVKDWERLQLSEKNKGKKAFLVTMDSTDKWYYLLEHIPYNPSYRFKGDVEILAGREYNLNSPEKEPFKKPGKLIKSEGYFFVPGTALFRDN